ncbi:glycosyl transferase, group 1 family protein [Reticulomyxa filosa]|uniref:Glycosyl transferase, group 1 family protein n=1 Tax=Reticulomyxa filosa TaxID=46433 RepID=X6PA41_RETFI|nr:glycosyl transferase, group 1 family protein [Reticulomyxa filosa]|eukprot:ETO34919.1 glycosyl transferase, group 1 family protein [Reticulomyxa filosa]
MLKIPYKILNKLVMFKKYYNYLTQRNINSAELEIEIFKDYIWRKVFQYTFDYNEKGLLDNIKLFVGDTSQCRISGAFPRKMTLNTNGYDFAIFQDSRWVQVSDNTIKITRYHDALPILSIDTVHTKNMENHYKNLKAASKNSIYVCNSEPVRQDLIKIIPELENKSYTIPCALPDNYSKVNDGIKLKSILISRLSSVCLLETQKLKMIDRIKNAKKLDYILHLATIEPRKNLRSLIKAWYYLHLKYGIKLIVNGSLGWKYQEILDEMKPYIKEGSLIHIEKLPPNELPILYSHAKAFIFPSFGEGFGLPPKEAMQCECPVIVSDIPAHKWVMGDAVLYCDPYSINDISSKIEYLLFTEEGKEKQKELISKGLERLKLYDYRVVGEQWINLFDTLKGKKNA